MGAYSTAVVADGASHYWRLNEASGLVAADQVGGAPGTISGGVTLGQPGPLADGATAMTFDGTTGQLVTAASLAIPLVATVELWAWCRDTAPHPHVTVKDERPAFYVDATRVLTIYDGANLADLRVTVRGAIVVSAGVWHHIVYVLTGSTAAFYLDGALDVSVAMVRTVAPTNVIEIGRDSAYGAALPGFWNGSLADVAIYPTALTPAQIANHYALRLATGPVGGARASIPWGAYTGMRPT